MSSSANAPSQDLKDIIDESSSNLVLTFGTDLFIATMPTEPDNCVCLYDYPGGPQGKFDHEFPNVQVKVRNRDYQTGYALCRDIKYFLHDEHNNEVINTTRYIRIYCISDILYLKQDEKNRYLWSINFSAERSGN